ncbi:MAG: sensor histidine kinase, partial [Gemmatimonadota bacterium]
LKQRLTLTSESQQSSASRVLRGALLLTALWTIPVILGLAGHFLGPQGRGPAMPRSHLIGHSMAMWYVWIPFTPLIFWLYGRIAFTRRRWPAALAGHLLILAIVFIAQTWITLVVGHATGHITPQITFAVNLRIGVVNLLLYDMLIYGGVLALAFSIDYARRYRDRDLRASQLETQLERARLETLQMQLQPHFLFNALNAIAMLVRRDRKQEAVDVIVGFGELLRYVLEESGTMDVPLSDEIRFVRRYLEIERVRLGDRLNVTIETTPEAEHAVVPNLLLQPLVENALKHGIVVRPRGGHVWIRAARRGDVLHIEVEDDGPGLPATFSIDGTSGIGLRNLRERIDAFYGDRGRLDLRASSLGGVLASIDIPFRSEMTRGSVASHSVAS